MKSMTSNQLRQSFLAFFRDRQHEVVASSPLVPGNDPTLLFTNAGMVQFKDVFLGTDPRSYTRAVTSQRCVRAGGKHNDLENVGYTARHHTFFEMLGNFSFGDYFKREAIQYAWEFLTGTLGLPPERLWVTVFKDDDEAADIWLKEIKVDPARFSRLGEKDNFWSMGDTGPCGPCSEIFFDHGADIPGGPPGSPHDDGDRYVEIWNLVFMQFDRAADGKMTPLPKPSVDTGMGLERIAAVMQGVHSNYQTDLFRELIDAAAKLLGVPQVGSSSLNVIADHIRACAFLVCDGVLPGNEGRGYVLRRIIRRAIRHGKKLGAGDAFFYKLVAPLAREMGEAYPELKKSRAHIEKVLHKEERRFAETLDQGMEILEAAIAGMRGKEIPGEVAFKLYDTYGFPLDLTADIARERGLSVDQRGFEQAMSGQRDRARAASKFAASNADSISSDAESEFLGYAGTDGASTIVALYQDGAAVDKLAAGDEGAVVLAATPFYAESGGQIGDAGILADAGKLFNVSDTQKSGKAIVHYGLVEAGELCVGDHLEAIVDAERRQATRLNHSATHLMHAALRTVLGAHVQQKGSLVTAEKLRFDFSHLEAVSASELQAIEELVNEQIRSNVAAVTRVMSYDDAIGSGAVALFGEKYGDRVRVLNFGEFSVELCGGTHVERTGDIGLFKIVSEGGVASGVRRIEAVTGKGALDWLSGHLQILQHVGALLKSQPDQLGVKVEQLLKRNKELEKELAAAKQALVTGSHSDRSDHVQEIAGTRLLVSRIDGADARTLRDAVDRYKDKLESAIVVLGSVDNGVVRLAAGVTRDNADRIKAGDLIKPIAEQVGGKGGGRPDFAQAGGNNPEALDAALGSVAAWVARQLR
ncbi:MAG: alanine--tRNA ligase [Gammaproteobacteria bacterium]|nr:alanine--tRNA ligase [Gammaproteobacteria bacterium]MDH5303543.1 alanine--tRNA ligase [Gammaproteobacteria bacterium]MDH5322241.1 alanine--tRNA ligase [Gammaproteobacteria bacterium]